MKERKRKSLTGIDTKSICFCKPIQCILIKSLFIITLFVFVILYLDTKGYFDPDQVNNHT
jgi:hypothetical protein